MIVMRGSSSGILEREIISVLPVSIGGFPLSEELTLRLRVPAS